MRSAIYLRRFIYPFITNEFESVSTILEKNGDTLIEKVPGYTESILKIYGKYGTFIQFGFIGTVAQLGSSFLGMGSEA